MDVEEKETTDVVKEPLVVSVDNLESIAELPWKTTCYCCGKSCFSEKLTNYDIKHDSKRKRLTLYQVTDDVTPVYAVTTHVIKSVELAEVIATAAGCVTTSVKVILWCFCGLVLFDWL